MLVTVTLIIAVIIYLFAPLNRLFFRLELHGKVLRIIGITHLLLLLLFTYLFVFNLLGKSYFFWGRYTNYIIFWGWLITGFSLAAFKLKNIIFKIYITLLQLFWVFALVVTFVVPLMGLLILMVVSSFANQPGKVVFEDRSFRIEESNEVRFMTPKYYTPYFLVEKKGIIEKKNHFSIGTDCKGDTTQVLLALIKPAGDSVLVTMQFNESCVVYHGDFSNSVTTKVKLN